MRVKCSDFFKCWELIKNTNQTRPKIPCVPSKIEPRPGLGSQAPVQATSVAPWCLPVPQFLQLENKEAGACPAFLSMRRLCECPRQPS